MSDGEKIARLTEALSWCLSELYGLKCYMARPDNGGSEWFQQEDLIEMDNARQVLNACGVEINPVR